MSTDKRPGMAINEEEIERHVTETRSQAARAHYPARPVRLHEAADADEAAEDPASEEPDRAGDRDSTS